MADQNDFDIAVFEAQGLDALLDRRDVLFEIGVDQDVALRGGDQIDGEVRCAYVLEVARDFECGELLMPVRIGLRNEGCRKSEEREDGF
jgi:hypothetical protein